MLLSSGVVWRHRDFRQFRAECPGGDVKLQRLVHERLDTHIEWLTGLGVRVLVPSTGNPETVGVRFDAASLTETLARQAGDDIRLGQALVDLPSRTPVILATGGFPASRELVGRYITPAAGSMMIRATPWSTGDGLRLGQAAGAETTSGLDEFYGRAMPAPPAVVRESDFVQLAQLYAHHARIESDDGERFAPRTWSEIDVVQWMARKPGARARFAVAVDSLGVRPRDLTIGEMIASAERAGGRVQRTPSTVSVDVVAGITSTLGGLKVRRGRPCGAGGVRGRLRRRRHRERWVRQWARRRSRPRTCCCRVGARAFVTSIRSRRALHGRHRGGTARRGPIDTCALSPRRRGSEPPGAARFGRGSRGVCGTARASFDAFDAHRRSGRRSSGRTQCSRRGRSRSHRSGGASGRLVGRCALSSKTTATTASTTPFAG